MDEMSSNLRRINELAKKAKTPEGLTPAEMAEREERRREYLRDFRSRMRGTLEQVVFVDEDGTQTPVRRKEEKGN